MATAFSVYVKIGGKLDGSLGAAVAKAKSQITGLASAANALGSRLQAPFVAIENGMKAAEKRMAAIARAGRGATLSTTLPGALMVGGAASKVYGFEKELNKAEAYGELADVMATVDGKVASAREHIEENARKMPRMGLAAPTAAVELQRRLIQAGRSIEAAVGMTEPTLRFSIFGDVDAVKAGDVITSVAAAYQKPMESVEEARAAAEHIGDVLAKGANISRADVADFAEGFKYAAPLASRAGMSIEELSASIATMNQNGLKGNEAGVAVRSMLVRMVKPTANARAALASYGLSFDEFVSKAREFKAVDLSGALAIKGIRTDAKLRAQIDKNIAGLTVGKDNDKIRQRVTDTIVKSLKLKPRDGKVVAKAVSDYMGTLAEEVDVTRLVEALHEKGVGLGAIANIFDARQGARLATLFNGPEYQKFLDILKSQSKGSSKKGSETMLKGIVGAFLRFKFAWDNLLISVARSGALEHATSLLVQIGASLDKLGQTNPEVLRMGTYLAMAALAAGPLVWALGSVGRLGAMALRGVAAAGRLLVWPLRAAAGAATLLRGALLFSGIGTMLAAIATAGVFIYNNWKGLLTFFQSFGAAFQNALGPQASAALTTVVGWLEQAGTWLSKITGEIDASGQSWQAWGTTAGTAVGNFVNNVTTTIANLPTIISTKFAEIGAAIESGLLSSAQHIASVVKQIVASVESAIMSEASRMAEAGRQYMQFFLDGLKSMGEAVLGWVRGLGARVSGAISGALGGGGNSRAAGGGGAAPAPPGRALGGPVSRGRPYIVGERGRELFVPGGAGRIVPNDALRALADEGSSALAAAGASRSGYGSPNVSVSITGVGGDPREVERAVDRGIRNAFARLETEQRGYLSD